VGRSDRILIAALAALGVVAYTAIVVLTVTGASEYIKLAIVMVLFIAILAGSYWFLLAPQSQREERDTE